MAKHLITSVNTKVQATSGLCEVMWPYHCIHWQEFDFSQEKCVMKKLKVIGFFDDLYFTDMEQVVAALKIRMDQLYEICSSHKEIQKAGTGYQKIN